MQNISSFLLDGQDPASYHVSVDYNPRPDFAKQLEYMRSTTNNYFDKAFTLDEYIHFVNYSYAKPVIVSDKVCMLYKNGVVTISDNESENPTYMFNITYDMDTSHTPASSAVKVPQKKETTVVPLKSHRNLNVGILDRSNSLTYILFAQGTTILVDPAEGVLQDIKNLGISVGSIQYIILTSAGHLHTSGMFELFTHVPQLDFQVVTFSSIYQLFTKRLAGLSAFPDSTIRRRFPLKSILIGATYKMLHNLEFKFYFGCSFNLSLVFSIIWKSGYLAFFGNSISDLEYARTALQKNVFSRQRFEQLMNISWDKITHSFFNVHYSNSQTSRRVKHFEMLPESIRGRIALNFEIKSSSGLFPKRHPNIAEKFLSFKLETTDTNYDIIGKLPFAKQLHPDTFVRLVDNFAEQQGTIGLKIKGDSKNRKLYVVKKGQVRSTKTQSPSVFQNMDYFNQNRFLGIKDDQGDQEFEAISGCQLLSISYIDFIKIVSEPYLATHIQPLLVRDTNLLLRNSGSPKLPPGCQPLRRVLQSKLYHHRFMSHLLESLFEMRPMTSGTILWHNDSPVSMCFLIIKGAVLVTDSATNSETIAGTGFMIGHIYQLLRGGRNLSKVQVIKDGAIMVAEAHRLIEFLKEKCSLLLYLFLGTGFISNN